MSLTYQPPVELICDTTFSVYSLVALLQFPVELVTAVVAGRWAASHGPAPPFLTAYWMRLAVNAAAVAIVAAFPAGMTQCVMWSCSSMLCAVLG
jgi:hypothetical protein